MKRILFIAAVLGIIGSVLWFNRGYLRPYFNHGQPIPLPPAEQYQNTESTSSAQFGASSTPPDLFPLEVSSKKSTTTKPLSSTTTKPLPVSAVDPFAWNGPLPSEKNLAVPFLSQAPKQNWNLPY
ncbi:MAG TPA: hypothetical protein VFQ60_05120, partial [Patescibacteria group bacterium]|nr:hypothetical protein [Patescibacteria group bacterium]